MRSWGLYCVVLVVALTAACSGSGDPAPGENGSRDESAGGAPNAEWTTPDGQAPSSTATRPAELTVDDVGSCDLLDGDQRGELGLTGERTSELSTTWSTDTCKIWDADEVLSASVTAVSTQDIDTFYQGRFTNLAYRPTEVRDFPALFYRFDGVEHACYLAVDVADGQLLDVAFGANDPDASDASLDELCDTARRITEAAVDTLLAAG